jgi:hypothetical protein
MEANRKNADKEWIFVNAVELYYSQSFAAAAYARFRPAGIGAETLFHR